MYYYVADAIIEDIVVFISIVHWVEHNNVELCMHSA